MADSIYANDWSKKSLKEYNLKTNDSKDHAFDKRGSFVQV